MTHEIFLIAAADKDAATLSAQFGNLLETVTPAVLLIPAGARDAEAYAGHVRDILPRVQQTGCAVLLDNRPELVRALGADGVHMTGGIKALAEAIGDLKPDFIVGTGDIGSRHEAMTRGEMDIDYLMFGDRNDTDGVEMANWWAETFEIPSVYRARAHDDPALATIGSEFVALADPDWDDPIKLKSIKGLAA
ncbi:thiamine phosphate synthase [Pelagibacterium xiamenense]|uniref:thiamine phosphate synthase n=1 Tax=Pelagibacterium xiamenense TaxID=2901140 RepID=UPI001E3A006D|nr:thiamine phosphate synthase [Pelagibacterium xiamenense]MCD7060479.1 thiamine phosphate synthase [Pelagibacterium xiamenense]